MALYPPAVSELPLSAHFRLGEFFRCSAYLDTVNPNTGRLFTPEELARLVPVVSVDDALLALLETLRDDLSQMLGQEVKIRITPHGGYRSPLLNKAVGGASHSRHRTGQAADILLCVSDRPLAPCLAAVLAEKSMDAHHTPGGVGCYGPASQSIHVDCRGSWAAWYIRTSGLNTPAQGGRPAVFHKGQWAAGIALLQSALSEKGYHCTADGKFGPVTQKALKTFQAASGLPPDGLFGPATNALLQPALPGTAYPQNGLLPWE